MTVQGNYVLIDYQVAGCVETVDMLRDLAENIRMTFFVRDLEFDGSKGLELIAQQINNDAGHNHAVHISKLVHADSVYGTLGALSDLHATCVMGELSYQIMVANPGQEGFHTLHSWEPTMDKQSTIRIVGELEPALDLQDLQRAATEDKTIDELIDDLKAQTSVVARTGSIKVAEGIFQKFQLMLEEEAELENTTTLKI